MTHAPNTPRERNSQGQKVDEPVQCVQCLQAWPCEVERQRQDIDELTLENDEGEEVRSQMADILNRTATALKGEAEPLTSHSWHDLPEVAAKLRHENQMLRATAVVLEPPHIYGEETL